MVSVNDLIGEMLVLLRSEADRQSGATYSRRGREAKGARCEDLNDAVAGQFRTTVLLLKSKLIVPTFPNTLRKSLNDYPSNY